MTDTQYVSQYDGILVRVGDRMVTVGKGAPVPPQAEPEHVATLLERGLIVEGEPAAGFVQEPGFSAASAPPLASPAVPADDDPDGPGPMPAKSASRADWDAWASTPTEQGGGGGLTLDEAQGFASKEALQQHFGVS